MRVFVPFDGRGPKTRLSNVLDECERRRFARVMLEQVLDVIQEAGYDPTVLATSDLECDCPVRVDARDLSVAVNTVLEETEGPVAIVMADLPLLTVDSVVRLFESPGDVVIAPGLGGGTNALVVRTSNFQVDYHGASFRDHTNVARERDVDLTVVDSFRLAVDVDESGDLLEVLLHGRNDAARWLREQGFTVDETDGEPVLLRSDEMS